jgi:hypothetical protein
VELSQDKGDNDFFGHAQNREANPVAQPAYPVPGPPHQSAVGGLSAPSTSAQSSKASAALPSDFDLPRPLPRERQKQMFRQLAPDIIGLKAEGWTNAQVFGFLRHYGIDQASNVDISALLAAPPAHHPQEGEGIKRLEQWLTAGAQSFDEKSRESVALIKHLAPQGWDPPRLTALLRHRQLPVPTNLSALYNEYKTRPPSNISQQP